MQHAGAGLAIAGGAALLVAAYYGLEARDISNEVERRYGAGQPYPLLAPLDARGDRAASISTVTAIGGFAALAAGTTLLVIDHRRRASISLEPSTRGGQIKARWSF